MPNKCVPVKFGLGSFKVVTNGTVCQFSNYRPISILPSFSKLYEQLVCNRLMNYWSKHSILYNNQYGFRSHRDTSMAVIDMVDKNLISAWLLDLTWLAAMDSNKFSIGLFIDLSKAFDTLIHKILLRRLNHYGIRGVLKWFESYLTNRYQYVEYNGVKSTGRAYKNRTLCFSLFNKNWLMPCVE